MEQKDGWDIRSRFSYETLGFLDDAFGKRHLELCLAAEGDDVWECGVAWRRIKIKVGCGRFACLVLDTRLWNELILCDDCRETS